MKIFNFSPRLNLYSWQSFCCQKSNLNLTGLHLYCVEKPTSRLSETIFTLLRTYQKNDSQIVRNQLIRQLLQLFLLCCLLFSVILSLYVLSCRALKLPFKQRMKTVFEKRDLLSEKMEKSLHLYSSNYPALSGSHIPVTLLVLFFLLYISQYSNCQFQPKPKLKLRWAVIVE